MLRFLESCVLEIWRMTLKNNRAPLLCYFKLCVSFRSHWWNQTGVTVRKRPIWVKFDAFQSRVTLKFDGWPSKTIWNLFYATSSFVQHFVAIGEFKLVFGPETPTLGQIGWFFWPCDLEIWRMTLTNNRAPLLSIIKLYASFHHHMWIQTGVTVRKRLSWVLTSVTFTFDLWPWPFAWTSLLSLVITPENSMMIRWWEHGEKGVMDGQTDGQTDRRGTDGLNQSYSCLVAAKNRDVFCVVDSPWTLYDVGWYSIVHFLQ